ncbi:DUF1214 domain-containing protein [Lysinibacter cavernae]|uniref:DUF1214 domain-containing protein n=1 Tax=Lysinibacter cavernae TaxID=1640652 RepID=A0A7X5QZR0_9MICO|nr:DUF1214 domain-containing protein [Lysinibacter cavernae]NIH52933.1 hypothetical protein [Lysinibacter cavernae]
MSEKTVAVNVDNFARAESDRMFDFVLHDTGGTNRWVINRQPTPLDHQPIIRQNRDTLYSANIVDASQGLRLTLPETHGRYASVMVVNQDHFIPRIIHEAGQHSLSAEEIGTPFALVGVRILVDPNDPLDIAAVNELQDQFEVEAGSALPFTHPSYDTASFDSTRNHLVALSLGIGDYRGAFGSADAVDPVRHLLGSASGWGGFPESEAMYLNVDPGLPAGSYELTVGDVPVDAFWSITVYNEAGYMEPNDRGVVSVNSVTAERNADGSVTVRFGDGDLPNTIPVPEHWNYMVRLYQPRAEAVSRDWVFPSLSGRSQ